MNATESTYASEVSAVAHRLVNNVRDAVEDGSWGVSEAAALDLWLRAELIPWARQQIGALPEPGAAGHLLRDLALLDARLLGTAGEAAVETAEHVELSVRRLAYAISPLR